MPSMYAYIRVSTDRQEEEGFSLEAQEKAAKAYYQILLAQPGNELLKWGGLHKDGGQSAYKKKFKDRTEGRKLYDRLKDGDKIVFCRLDRAFRRFHDAVNQMEEWKGRGIGVHFIDQSWNLETPSGEACFRIMAVMAELESRQKSERIKDALSLKKSMGKPVNQKVPPGMEKIGGGKNQRYILDKENRSIIRLIKFYRNHCELSYKKISDALEKCLASRERRAYISETHFKDKREWTTGRVRKICDRLDILMPDGKPSERRKVWNKYTRGGCYQ